jgi:hypothetical protein
VLIASAIGIDLNGRRAYCTAESVLWGLLLTPFDGYISYSTIARPLNGKSRG